MFRLNSPPLDDSLDTWATQCVAEDAGSRVASREVFRSWQKWAEMNDCYVQSHKAVCLWLASKGARKIKSNGVMVFLGLRLRSQ